MAKYTSYEDIKAKYSLLDYICSQGFEIDKKKSSATWIVLKNNGQKLLYNTKNLFYKNVEVSEDKGDILNFVANRVSGTVIPTKDSKDIFEAISILKDFDLESHNDLIQSQTKIVSKKILESKLAKTDFNCTELNDYSYFTIDRSISKFTLTSNLFKGRLFNSYFRLERNQHIITNFAFGKYRNDKLVGLEVRNKNLSHISGDHDSIFHSNFNKDKSIDLIFIAESGIDALSHYELFKKNEKLLNKNIVYISTGGNFYDKKIEEIFNFFKQLKIKDNSSIISITDNDVKGLYYDYLLLSNLINENTEEKLTFKNNDHFYIYSFDNLSKEKFDKITEIVNNKNDQIQQLYKIPAYGDYFVIKKESDKIDLHIPIGVSINSTFIMDLSEILKFKKVYVSHKPKNHKDWNEFLQEKKKAKKITLKSSTVKNSNKLKHKL